MDLEGDDEDFILNDEEEQVPTFFISSMLLSLILLG
jgi:hypothetical protein